jgi:hypothetical protein
MFVAVCVLAALGTLSVISGRKTLSLLVGKETNRWWPFFAAGIEHLSIAVLGFYCFQSFMPINGLLVGLVAPGLVFTMAYLNFGIGCTNLCAAIYCRSVMIQTRTVVSGSEKENSGEPVAKA